MRKFRLGEPAPPAQRRFRLPEVQRAAPIREPKSGALPGQDYRHALLHPEPPAPPARQRVQAKVQTPARSAYRRRLRRPERTSLRLLNRLARGGAFCHSSVRPTAICPACSGVSGSDATVTRRTYHGLKLA